MIITILTDNKKSWILPYVDTLKQKISNSHDIIHIFTQNNIIKGDILIILGCEKIIPKNFLLLNKTNIVVHPSALPKGKGFSPLAWQILEGKSQIILTLFEATTKVDSGKIYLQSKINLNGHELNNEIKKIQGEETIKLVLKFIKLYPNICGKNQEGKETFYQRRTKEDMEIDPSISIKEQFNLFRVADNDRYPVFFYLNGHKYFIKIDK